MTIRYRELVPAAPLRSLVHRLWILRGDAGKRYIDVNDQMMRSAVDVL